MYTLTILCVFDPLTKLPDKEFVLDNEYEFASQAELRGLRWLMYRPNDIVMLTHPSDTPALT